MQRAALFGHALFFSLFFTIPLQCQEEAWRFGLEFSSSYVDFINTQDQLESRTPLTLGIRTLFHYPLSENLEIKAGVGFEYLQAKRRDFSLIFGNDIDPISGVIDQRRSFQEVQFQALYIAVPINFQYYFRSRHQGWYSSFGFDFLSAIMQNNRSTLFEGGTAGETTLFEAFDLGFGAIHYLGKLAVGYGIPLSKGEHLLITVYYRRQLNNLRQEDFISVPLALRPINQTPFQTAGLQLGLLF